MGSFCHRLRSNKRVGMPTRLIFYDCETTREKISIDVFKHHLRLGYACAVTRYNKGGRIKEEWCKFENREEFWNFVLKFSHKKSKVYLIAHNTHFDFPVVDGFKYLVKKGWSMSFPVLDSKLFILTFRKDGRCIKVLDSLNWFKFSVEQLGEEIGLPKGEIDFNSCSNEELSKYCKRDVEIIKIVFMEYLKFLQKYDLGNFKSTIPSQAFTAFRHRFMDDEIFIHDVPEVVNLERQSYRGGRNEAFQLGPIDTEVIGLDFNSLYPAVMVNAEVPTKLIKHTKNVSVDYLRNALKRECVVAKVNVTIDEPCIAVNRERLLFPIGTFDVTLTTPELQYILKHHKINAVKNIAQYKKAKIFEGYIKQLYQLRLNFKQQNNRLYDTLTKLFLNSLYGKFGQKNEIIKEVDTCSPDIVSYERVIRFETRETFLIWRFGGKVYMKTPEWKESRHSFPAVASHITALARMKLWNAIKTAGLHNCYYCDTDSLFVNKEGYKRLKHLIDKKKLGHLKVEYKTDDMSIFGCKDYKIGNKIKIKGVKENATKEKKNVYSQTRFLKFRSLLRRRSLDAPIEERYTKTLSREYKKGIIRNDGRVIPFSLPSPRL